MVLLGLCAPEAVGEALDAALADAETRLSVKDAAAEVAARLGLPRKLVGARALERRRGKAG